MLFKILWDDQALTKPIDLAIMYTGYIDTITQNH